VREVKALSGAEIDEIIAACRFDDRGLIPCVTVDDESRDVLMVAWMNADAIRLTLEERRVTYWSRSRTELWRKGETSGHTQKLRSFALDCDADVIRITVEQTGPACHTGSRTCFDGDPLAVAFTQPNGDGAHASAHPGAS